MRNIYGGNWEWVSRISGRGYAQRTGFYWQNQYVGIKTSYIQQLFIIYLLCARHFPKHWDLELVVAKKNKNRLIRKISDGAKCYAVSVKRVMCEWLCECFHIACSGKAFLSRQHLSWGRNKELAIQKMRGKSIF